MPTLLGEGEGIIGSYNRKLLTNSRESETRWMCQSLLLELGMTAWAAFLSCAWCGGSHANTVITIGQWWMQGMGCSLKLYV